MNKQWSIGFIFSLLAFLSAPASAVDGNVGTVTHLYVYSDYGTGDVVIRVQTPLSGCQHGFWLRMTDAGAKLVYAKLLTAQETNSPLRISAHESDIWPGSSGQYCRISMVGTPG
jgi:hypothetical protein